MVKSKYLENLIDALTILPGVGRKTAQRMAYSLLYGNIEKSLFLSDQLKNIETKIIKCESCGMYSDFDPSMSNQINCPNCNRDNVNANLVCVVESASDVYTIDESTSYNGFYFVLQGNLSPIDGRGRSSLLIMFLAKPSNTQYRFPFKTSVDIRLDSSISLSKYSTKKPSSEFEKSLSSNLGKYLFVFAPFA